MSSPRKSLPPNLLNPLPPAFYNGTTVNASFPLPALPPSASPATQAQILQLQAQILQLQAQLLLRPAAPEDLPLDSAPSSPVSSPASPPPPFEATQSPPRSRSLSSSSEISPLLVPRAKNSPKTLAPLSAPRHSMPPLLAPRLSSGSRTASPARSTSSESSSRHSGLGASPRGDAYRQYQEDSHKMLTEAESMLIASKKSLEQRAHDLDQFRHNTMPRSPKPEPASPPSEGIEPLRDNRPPESMSDIAAKVLSVLHERHTGSDSPSLRDTDSLDDIQSLADSITDEERSVSSKEVSRVHQFQDESLLPNVVKGGNLLKKSGLRGWRKRYVLLNATALCYYKGSVLSASLPITGDAEVRLGPGAEFVVSDGAKKETIVHLAATSETERKEWTTAIQELIDIDKKSKRYETRNGEVNLRFWFEEEKFTLHVSVVRARGLKRRTKKVNVYNNPYVKLKILPRQGKKFKTRVIKSCVDPIWDETFRFRLERSTLTVQTLQVKVKNDETGSNGFFGEVSVPLLNASFDEREPTDAWFPLQNSNVEKKDDMSAVVPITESKTHHGHGSSSGHFLGLGDISSMSSADFETKRLIEIPPEVALSGDESERSVGMIRATVWYDTDTEMLKVEVLECRLQKVKQHFVELKILPSEADVHPCKTKVHKDDAFHEKFDMPLGQAKVTFSTLSFAVKDRRTTFGKSRNIGEFVLPLDKIPRTTAGATQTHWLTPPSSTIFELHTLGDILLLEAGFESFSKAAAKEHSMENLHFWKDVQDFRYKYLDAFEDQRPNCMSECIEICNKYIDVGAESEINVPPSIKNQIRARIREETQTYSNWCESLACIFDRAQSEVLDLMSRDSFARYLSGQEWANFSKYLQQESTEKELGFKVVNMIMDYSYVHRAREAMIEQRNLGRLTQGSRNVLPPSLPDPEDASGATPRQLRPRLVSTSVFR